MKVVVSCDDVFEVLTRGPFPTGRAQDEQVDAHLAVCHECRQLAEALRPAVDLIQEAMLENEKEPLPVYLGRFHATVSEPPVKPRRPPTGSSSQLTGVSVVALLAIVALFVVTCEGLFSDGETPSAQQSMSVFGGGVIRGVKQQVDEPLLSSLGVPLSCFPGRNTAHMPIENLVAADGHTHASVADSIVCCTRCHHAGGNALHSDRGIRVVTASCIACHERAASPQQSVQQSVSRLPFTLAGPRVS